MIRPRRSEKKSSPEKRSQSSLAFIHFVGKCMDSPGPRTVAFGIEGW